MLSDALGVIATLKSESTSAKDVDVKVTNPVSGWTVTTCKIVPVGKEAMGISPDKFGAERLLFVSCIVPVVAVKAKYPKGDE